MGFSLGGNISGSNAAGPNPDQYSDIADVTAVVLNVQNQKVQVERAKILDIAKGLAEIAYSMGQTNDPDELAEEMADDIFEALKKVKRKRDKKKRNK